MPRIVYLSWPAGEISGGIKAAFQHVAMLAEAGLAACVATEDGKAAPWFESPVEVITLDRVRADDVLVFPENHEALFGRFAGSRQPKLVFCQNPHQVWRGVRGHAGYEAHGVAQVLCASHTVLQYCLRRMPAMPLAYTPFYIDHQVFTDRPGKKLQVACVPRKRPLEAMAVRDLFIARHPRFAHWPWVLIQNVPEAEVARVMGESAVFLSLSRLEAHGMTTLEAMASGCLVAGFTGIAGGPGDSATAGNGFWAAEDDVSACAEQLALAAHVAEAQGLPYQAMRAESLRSAARYRREETARQVVDTWRALLPQLRG